MFIHEHSIRTGVPEEHHNEDEHKCNYRLYPIFGHMLPIFSAIFTQVHFYRTDDIIYSNLQKGLHESS